VLYPARASRPGRRDYSAHLRDSASDPARELDANFDPACLSDPARASGLGRRDYSAGFYDSASDPARGLGANFDPACFSDPVLALLKYPFYPLFNFDNGINLISESLTILTSAQLLVVFAFAHIFWRYFIFAGF